MNRFLGKYAPYFYAVLRIVTGLMFELNPLTETRS